MDLPKPNAPITELDTRERIHDNRPNQLLGDLGERVKPEGMIHMGSIALHIYKHPLDPNKPAFMSCTQGLEQVPELIIQYGFKELALVVMERYGRKPPKKRNEEWKSEDVKASSEIG